MNTKGLELKVARMERKDLERFAVQAMLHLCEVSDSRNSFSSDYLEAATIAGVGFPKRNQMVENMHIEAVNFINREDV